MNVNLSFSDFWEMAINNFLFCDSDTIFHLELNYGKGELPPKGNYIVFIELYGFYFLLSSRLKALLNLRRRNCDVDNKVAVL
jgi:hypothetical protein